MSTIVSTAAKAARFPPDAYLAFIEDAIERRVQVNYLGGQEKRSTFQELLLHVRSELWPMEWTIGAAQIEPGVCKDMFDEMDAEMGDDFDDSNPEEIAAVILRFDPAIRIVAQRYVQLITYIDDYGELYVDWSDMVHHEHILKTELLPLVPDYFTDSLFNYSTACPKMSIVEPEPLEYLKELEQIAIRQNPDTAPAFPLPTNTPSPNGPNTPPTTNFNNPAPVQATATTAALQVALQLPPLTVPQHRPRQESTTFDPLLAFQIFTSKMYNQRSDVDMKPYSPYEDPDAFSGNSDMDIGLDLDLYCYTIPSDPSVDRPANIRHIMTAYPPTED